MTLVNKILILGAGQAAVYAANEIRKHDVDSIIKIFNAENYKGSIIWVIGTFLFLSYRVFSLRLIVFG